MAELICTRCFYTGEPRKKKRGSGKVELMMWMIFPLGLPYTFWRMLGKTLECRHCGNNILVTQDSPMGKRITAQLEEEIAGPTPVRHAPVAASPVPAAKAKEEPPFPPAERAKRLPPDPDKW